MLVDERLSLPEAIQVRPATQADLAALIVMTEAIQALHVAHHPQQFKPMDPAELASFLDMRLRDTSTQVWIAELAGTAAGHAVTTTRERPKTVFHHALVSCELEQLGVLPAFQRRGVARALVERVLDEARARGISDVTLCTWTFNTAAQRAFAALGFAPEYTRFRRSSTRGATRAP